MVKWAYILIGNDKTGKTTFQKELIQHITGSYKTKLYCNLIFPIEIRIGSRNSQTISFMNRSYQEKDSKYDTVQEFFTSDFKDTDIAILSSHLCKTDIEEMIRELKKRFFNVEGVFFENSIALDYAVNQDISLLEWDERYFVQNPTTKDEAAQKNMIRKSALEFGYHILNKT